MMKWNDPAPQPGYSCKPKDYFSGARKLFVDCLPINPEARLLEIGCGSGATAAYALATKKCGWCAGVELCSGPAAEASQHMNDVRIGDVEKIDLPYPAHSFDILIMSEVIEHLVDPWGMLRKMRLLLTNDAFVLAGSPNVAYRKVITMLLRGRWDYVEAGIMDRTHLRWFTPDTYKELFEDCGYTVLSCEPAPPTGKAGLLNTLTGRRFEYLLSPQILLKAKCQKSW